MKRYLPILLALIATITVQTKSQACIASSAYGTLTADNNIFTAQEIESCNYAGEYATVTLPAAGTWTFESEVATDYLTITTTGNVGIDSGTTPVTITTTGSVTIRLHVHTNSSCGTQSSCRVTSVTKAPCLSSSSYGSLTASASTFVPQEIEACNYAGEYATVTLPSGGLWTFSSEDPDWLFLTNTSNEILAAGPTPLDYTASGAETVRLHIFTDSACGTQSTCRATFVAKSPCLSSTQYPSSMVVGNVTYNASTTITSCNYAGEFAIVHLPEPGNWEFNSSDTNDFLVITNTNNEVLASGVVPVSYSTSVEDTVHMHIFTNANCGTESTCRTTTVTRTPCLSSTQYPSGTDTANTTPVPLTISTCNYAGEFYQVVLFGGNSYDFTSSDTNDVFYFTDTNNTFYFAQQSTATANVTGSGSLTVRVHIFQGFGCSEESVCRTTQVICTTCPVPEPTITATDSIKCVDEGALSLGIASGTAFSGTIYWFEGSCGGTPIDSGSSISVNPLTTTWYYAANSYEGQLSLCDSIEVTVNDLPTIAFTNVTDVSCNGLMDGEATAEGSGTLAPYTYSWSNSASTATSTGMGAGEYYVTDDNGCINLDTVTVDQPDSLIGMTSNASEPLCNGDSTGSIEVSSTGGTMPYVYAWSSGGTNATETDLAAGAYTVTITDDNGCQDEVEYTLTEPAALSNTFTVEDAECATDMNGGIMSAVAGGTTPYSYSWSTTGSNDSISGLGAGVYYLDVTDSNGCTYMDSAEVDYMFENPTVSMSDSNVLCTGFEYTLDAGNSGSTFTWSEGSTTQTITVTAAGMYTVTVVDGNGCEGSQSVSVIEDECLGVDEVSNLIVMEVFPNPSQGAFTVKLNGMFSDDASLEIISMQGQRVALRNLGSTSGEVMEQFDMSGLAKGVYFLNLRHDGKLSTQRIVLQ